MGVVLTQQVFAKLLHVCSLFTSYSAHMSRSLGSVEDALNEGSGDTDEAQGRMKKLEDGLERYEENFRHHLSVFMDSMNYFAAVETVALLGIGTRLSMAVNQPPSTAE